MLPVDTTHPLAYGPLHASCLAGKSARAGESELSYTSPFQSRDYYIPSYISLEIDRTWYPGGTSSAFRLPPRLQNGDQLDAVEYSAPHRSYSTVGTHSLVISQWAHHTYTTVVCNAAAGTFPPIRHWDSLLPAGWKVLILKNKKIEGRQNFQ